MIGCTNALVGSDIGCSLLAFEIAGEAAPISENT